MPKHEGPLQKLVDPFSIPAQMNNIGVLVVAYVTVSLQDQTGCSDPGNDAFLWFIYYGSTIVCGGTLVLSVLYMLGIIDYCINSIMPCGQVCLTLNTLTVFLLGLLYHCVATVYALEEGLFHIASRCVELEMFKRITCTIYAIWFVCIVGYAIFYYCRKKKTSSIQENLVEL